MIQLKQTWPLGLSLFLFGCGSKSTVSSVQPAPPIPSASVKSGDEGTLFPVQVGSQWIYSAEGIVLTRQGKRQLSTEVTIRVAKVTPSDKGTLADFEISANGKLTNKQQYLVAKDGLYQTESGMKMEPVTPPQLLVKFPIKDGEKFSWTGVGPFGADAKAAMKAEGLVRGSRIVDTETGQVSAILVRSVSTLQSPKAKGGVELSIWFKPGTGIVRLEQTSIFPDREEQETLRLKSYTPKSS